jgi:hypothetical protein
MKSLISEKPLNYTKEMYFDGNIFSIFWRYWSDRRCIPAEMNIPKITLLVVASFIDFKTSNQSWMDMYCPYDSE